MTASIARVLVVAGSDCSGGAGIQADIKTATALGAYAMTAITAVTVQDTTGVHSFHPVPPNIIAGQIDVVLSDMGADAIKTGMLVSAEAVEALSRALKPHASIPLVVDTVMIAKGGAALLDEAGILAMRKLLFPIAALVTPNAPEAARLTGLAVETPEDLVRAGQHLIGAGVRAVLIKGGHLAGDAVTDVLVDQSGTHMFRTRRIDGLSAHGTGCTLAMAIATGLAQGLSLISSIERARDYVQNAIRAGFKLGSGSSLLNHLHAIAPYKGGQ